MSTKKLKFEIFIDAPVEKVWNTMLEKDTYEEWTTVFSEGSSYEGSWEEGAEILFTDATKSGGMVATVKECRLHEFVSLEHVAMLVDGKADYEAAKDWAPAYENYTFESVDGGTLVKIDQDMIEEYVDMFKELWPRALQKLKEVCES